MPRKQVIQGYERTRGKERTAKGDNDCFRLGKIYFSGMPL